jgi:putative membrane protein
MILPGISGSFILILLGGYYTMMHAIDVQHPNLPLVAVFAAGAVVGLISFSNLLSWLFKHVRMITLAALTGFMLGSLNKIWPWKDTLETFTDSHGKTVPLIQQNILPHNTDGDLPYALGLMLAGLLIIFVIEFVAAQSRRKSSNG